MIHMTINEADNVMYGDAEVQKVYCGDALVWERGGGHIVPTGYEALDYFDNQGRYSLNTGLKPMSGTLKFECSFSPNVDVSVDRVLVGGFLADPYSLRDAGTIWLLQEAGKKISVRMRGNYGDYRTQSDVNSVSAGEIVTASGTFASATTLTVNGVTYTGIGGAVLARDVWITGNGAYNQSDVASAKIYFFKFWDGTTLARDMVPVKRLSDDKYGMWDFVTQIFYAFG